MVALPVGECLNYQTNVILEYYIGNYNYKY